MSLFVSFFREICFIIFILIYVTNFCISDKFQRQIDCFSIKELFFILVFLSNNKIKKSFRDMESVSKITDKSKTTSERFDHYDASMKVSNVCLIFYF